MAVKGNVLGEITNKNRGRRLHADREPLLY